MRIFGSMLILFCIISISYGQSFKDFETAFPVCEMKTYHFGEMGGRGNLDQIGPLNCASNFSETNSIWLKFTIEKPGVVTFVISPEVIDDDIDFVLFRRSKTNSNGHEVIRCMASGENKGRIERNDQNCKGSTGLSLSSLDDFERAGCKFNDDNFLKFLQGDVNEEYVLLINNFNSRNGFSISFDGNASLKTLDGCEAIILSEPVIIQDLYPNPTNSILNLEFISINKKPVRTTIFGLNGGVITSFELIPEVGLNKNTIVLNSIPQGTYLLKMTQESFSTVKQFIKI